jgi:hypothetical protein
MATERKNDACGAKAEEDGAEPRNEGVDSDAGKLMCRQDPEVGAIMVRKRNVAEEQVCGWPSPLKRGHDRALEAEVGGIGWLRGVAQEISHAQERRDDQEEGNRDRSKITATNDPIVQQGPGSKAEKGQRSESRQRQKDKKARLSDDPQEKENQKIDGYADAKRVYDEYSRLLYSGKEKSNNNQSRKKVKDQNIKQKTK